MAKELSITELQAERSECKKRCNEIVLNAKQDGERRMTDAESKEYNENYLRMHEIDMEIDERKQTLKNTGTPVSNKERFSLRRAILNAATRGASQTDAEMQAAAGTEAANNQDGADNVVHDADYKVEDESENK